MFKWLMRLFGRGAPRTAEEEAAYQEAKVLRRDMQTLKTGDLTGSTTFTHRGREGRDGG